MSLEVSHSQVTGVVDQSGCATSTFTGLLLRLIEATSGSVHFSSVYLVEVSRLALRQLRQQMQIVVIYRDRVVEILRGDI